MRKILTLLFILWLVILASCGEPEQEMTPKQNWTPKLDS